MLSDDKVDVPTDFYDEEIFSSPNADSANHQPQLFDSPDQLIEMFSLLEEQNLKKIRACQDIEEGLEKEKQDEIIAITEKGGEYLKHEQQNFELDERIRMAKEQLAELEKQSKLANMAGDAQVKATKKKKDDE
jgi:hypothetical protein